jgi:hypothetical protein
MLHLHADKKVKLQTVPYSATYHCVLFLFNQWNETNKIYCFREKPLIVYDLSNMFWFFLGHFQETLQEVMCKVHYYMYDQTT